MHQPKIGAHACTCLVYHGGELARSLRFKESSSGERTTSVAGVDPAAIPRRG